MRDPVGEASLRFASAQAPESEEDLAQGFGPAELHQADAAAVDRQALRESALRQARRLVEFYRITPSELLAGDDLSKPAGSAEADPAPAAAALPVKYRHPVSGETWDGQGPHPQWMRQALLKDGYRVADLKVDDTDF